MAQIESGKITTDKAKILKFIIDRGGSNIVHMESLLPMKNQTLTARLSDLEDLGLIYSDGYATSANHSTFKYQPNEAKQELYAANRKAFKFEQWKRRGLEMYGDLMQSNLVNALNANY